MSELAAAQAAEMSFTEEKDITSALSIYGTLSSLLVVVPIVVYILQSDVDGYAKYHMTYIKMLAVTYFPLAASWEAVMTMDSKEVRMMVGASLAWAGMGPFSLLWVGVLSMLWAVIGGGMRHNGTLKGWIIGYTVGNCLLIATHWLLSPIIYNWLEKAPLPEDDE